MAIPLRKVPIVTPQDQTGQVTQAWYEWLDGAADSLGNVSSSTGASGIGFIQSGTGAVATNLLTTGRTVVSAFHFMTAAQIADVIARTNTLDVSAAIIAAVANLQARGGGILDCPIGWYKMDASLPLAPMADSYHNIIIRGAGKTATTFDFSSAAAGSDGFGIYGWGGRISIEKLTVKSAPAIGINVNAGNSRDGVNYISRINIKDVIVTNCGTDGIKMVQTYVGNFENIESRNNAAMGFNLSGPINACVFTNCWSGGDAVNPQGGNGTYGWYINGAYYCQFNNCYADWSGAAGYLIRNSKAVKFTGCGSESNAQQGFLVDSSTTDSTGVVFSGVEPVAFDSCFGFRNSYGNGSTYTNFLAIGTGNSKDAYVTANDCADLTVLGYATNSVVLDGASGTVYYEERGNRFTGTYAKSGTVIRTNFSVIGKSTMAQISGNQSCTDGTDTVAGFNTRTTNNLGCFLSGGALIIPATVSRIKVTAGAYWDTNSTGDRAITIYKNAAVANGLSMQKNKGSAYTQQSLSTAIIEVAANDEITMIVNQSSGGALDLVGNTFTFMSVEAMG